ncbi:hypothetical protein J6590_072160 [Homalodisca vitripennis]|nr:hypothetical protein J6590_072160 [Homalodisca vitripennis]
MNENNSFSECIRLKLNKTAEKWQTTSLLSLFTSEASGKVGCPSSLTSRVGV